MLNNRKTKSVISENIQSIDDMVEALQVMNEGLLSGKINYYSSQLNYVLVNCEKFFILNNLKERGINNFDEFKSAFDSLSDTLEAFGNDTKENYFSKERFMPDMDRKQEINNLIKNCYKHCKNKNQNVEQSL